MKVWYDFFVSPFAILIISTHYSFPAVNNRHHDEFDDVGPIHPDCLSVERPSYLRSDFVNLWRHPRLVVPHVTHVSFVSIVHSDLSDDLMLFRGLVLLFRSFLDLFNQEDAAASVWKGYFNVSPRSSLLAHQEGPFSGCYWVTSLEWPRIEWHSWRITRTSK